MTDSTDLDLQTTDTWAQQVQQVNHLEDVPGASTEVIAGVCGVFHRHHEGPPGLIQACIYFAVEGSAISAADAHLVCVQCAPKQSEEVHQKYTQALLKIACNLRNV